MYKQIEPKNSKMHYSSRVKSFWSVQNKQPVVDDIKELNSRKNHRQKLFMTFPPFIQIFHTINQKYHERAGHFWF